MIEPCKYGIHNPIKALHQSVCICSHTCSKELSMISKCILRLPSMCLPYHDLQLNLASIPPNTIHKSLHVLNNYFTPLSRNPRLVWQNIFSRGPIHHFITKYHIILQYSVALFGEAACYTYLAHPSLRNPSSLTPLLGDGSCTDQSTDSKLPQS